jgi:hypothetical protein
MIDYEKHIPMLSLPYLKCFTADSSKPFSFLFNWFCSFQRTHTCPRQTIFCLATLVKGRPIKDYALSAPNLIERVIGLELVGSRDMNFWSKIYGSTDHWLVEMYPTLLNAVVYRTQNKATCIMYRHRHMYRLPGSMELLRVLPPEKLFPDEFLHHVYGNMSSRQEDQNMSFSCGPTSQHTSTIQNRQITTVLTVQSHC